MTNDGTHTYFYDAEDRLVQVDGTLGTCSTATACYFYDALGQRVDKQTGSYHLSYIHDLSGNGVTEYCAPCTWGTGWNRGYVYMNGQQVAEYAGGTTYFVHSDHLGSARLRTALNQSIYDSTDLLPFGEIIGSSYNATHYFTGDEHDYETNLDHTWFRQYSSQFGRWMHPDPAGLAAVDPSNPQSWNRYAYVLNNPLAYTDPAGLVCVWDDGSYDAADDTVTGSPDGCAGQGGTWIDDTMGGNWSAAPDPDLADLVDYLNSGQQTTIQTTVWGTSLDSDPAGDDLQPSWAWTFTTEFFKFSGGPGNVPTCAGQTLSQVGNEMFGDLVPSTTAETSLKAASTFQTARAFQYAATQTNTFGGTGLVCPRCSSVFRSMTTKAEVLGEASEAVPLLEAGYYAGKSIPGQMAAARSGACAAAFPIF